MANRRDVPWSNFAPLIWAPILPLIRITLRGRVQPKTQHTVFFGACLLALSHAGYMMGQDSSMSAGT